MGVDRDGDERGVADCAGGTPVGFWVIKRERIISQRVRSDGRGGYHPVAVSYEYSVNPKLSDS
jgi:hypothetical protein